MRKAAKYFAWFWKNRPYRTAPHIKARFGRSTLVNLYYYWRRNGKSPNCFGLHYGDHLTPITAEEIRRFVDACGAAGTRSMAQVARLVGFERGRACRILARLPRPLVRRIKEIFKERRQAETEVRKVTAQLQGGWHRLLEIQTRKMEAQLQGRLRRLQAAEASRSRKVQRLADSLLKMVMGRRADGMMDSTSFEKDRPIQGAGEIFKAVLQGVGNSQSPEAENPALRKILYV